MKFGWLWLKKHIEKAKVELSEPIAQNEVNPWGLMDTDFNIILPAQVNQTTFAQNFRSFYQTQLLWKENMQQICRERKIRGFSKLYKTALGHLLLDTIPPEELRSIVRKYIKLQRDLAKK